MKLRGVKDLNQGWEFVRERKGRRWLSGFGAGDVELPHCWNADDAFKDGVEYYRGWGSYRREFELAPEEVCGWRLHLVAEGFYGTGDVWLNGHCLGQVDGQYLGFDFDVTDIVLQNKKNVVGVRLSNRCRKSVLPGNPMPDFLLYGGLSGRLRLEFLPSTRLLSGEARVLSEVDESGGARLRLEYAVAGDDAGECGVSWQVLDAGMSMVGEAGGSAEIALQDVELWDVDRPYMYQARVVLERDGVLVDQVELFFGIRTAEFRCREGFFLNGRRLELRGCNRHESMPGYGRALSLEQHWEDARLIKAMGLNFVRLSHYPQHPEFLRACDELGILVYAEVASWKSVRGGRWLKNACRQLHDMVVRDRNHPSIILWGMGNEGRHRGAYEKMYALCKELDGGRAVTYAENHLYRARRKNTLGIVDVWGLNYEFDALQDGCEASRLKCVVVSECSNYPHTERGDAAAERKQLDIIRADLARIAGVEYVAGFALWCFNDYATLRKQRYRRFSGLVDARRQPKASAFWLAEHFGGDLSVLEAAEGGAHD